MRRKRLRIIIKDPKDDERRKRQRIQKIPYDKKVEYAKKAIAEYANHYNGMVFVEYGGGIKSDALAHLARSVNPHIRLVYIDNGCDYEEIRQHALKKADIIRTPEYDIRKAITEYGYPFLGRRIDTSLERLNEWGGERSIVNSFRYLADTPYETVSEITQESLDEIEWLHADFNISCACCDLLYKKPIAKVKGSMRMAGISPHLASDSRQVIRSFFEDNESECHFKKDRTKSRCYPFTRWYRTDIIRYLEENNIDYCKEYYGDIIRKEGKTKPLHSLAKKGRSSCKYCPYGSFSRGHMHPKNKWEQMKTEHPNDYRKIIGGGDYVNGVWKPNRKGLGFAHIFDYIANQLRDNKYLEYK